MMARTLWRSLRVIEHLCTGVLIVVYIRFFARLGRPPDWVPQVVCWWYRRLCRALGVRLRVTGQVAPGCLLVSNHVSWLDVPVIGAQHEIGFLSKSEVKGWPVIGWIAEIVGTHFIERGAHQVSRVSSSIIADVLQGRPVVIFPEGTTSDGCRVGHFHPRLFSIAQGTGIGIQPVAIGYRHGDSVIPDTRAPYIGDDILIASLWRIICHPDLVVHLAFLPPLPIAKEVTRRTLADDSRLAIRAALGLAPDQNGAYLSKRLTGAIHSGQSAFADAHPG